MNFEEKVSVEVAEKEVIKWLDTKKVSTKRRKDNASSIETLIDAITSGDVFINDKGEFEQTLKFPIPEFNLEKLTFKARVPVSDFQQRTKAIDPRDAESRLLAYVSVLTDKGAGPLSKMDPEDMVIAQSVAIFFL